MNKNYSDLKLSPYFGLPILKKHITKGLNDLSLENVIIRNKEIELENNRLISSRKANKKLQTIIDTNNLIIDNTKTNNNLINKSQIIFNIKKDQLSNNSIKTNNLLNVISNTNHSTLNSENNLEQYINNKK